MYSFRKAYVWLTLSALTFAVLMWSLFVFPRFTETARLDHVQRVRSLARGLLLTDLCLFTDGRYLRHLSQADFHSAFQDNPGSFDYFPSGSLLLPPYFIWGSFYDMAENADPFH
jgi:hypothetical protein